MLAEASRLVFSSVCEEKATLDIYGLLLRHVSVRRGFRHGAFALSLMLLLSRSCLTCKIKAAWALLVLITVRGLRGPCEHTLTSMNRMMRSIDNDAACIYNLECEELWSRASRKIWTTETTGSIHASGQCTCRVNAREYQNTLFSPTP